VDIKQVQAKDVIAWLIIVGYILLNCLNVDVPLLDVVIPVIIGYYFGSKKK